MNMILVRGYVILRRYLNLADFKLHEI